MSKLEKSKLFNTIIGGFQERSVFTDIETGISHNIMIWEYKKFPLAHKYIFEVLNVLTNLETTIESIKLVESLIGNVEKVNIATENSNSALLKYFVKNWIGNYITVYEVVLQLIYLIFELGNDKKPTKTKIEKNDIFNQEKELYVLTKSICDLVWSNTIDNDKLLVENNRIKHQGLFKHKSIDNLSSKEFWRKYGIKEDEDIDFEIDRGLVKIRVLKDIKERNKMMIENIYNLCEYLNDIFELRFEEKRKGYKSYKL